MKSKFGNRILGGVFVAFIFSAYSHLAIMVFGKKDIFFFKEFFLGDVFFAIAFFLIAIVVYKSRKQPEIYSIYIHPFKFTGFSNPGSIKNFIVFIFASLAGLFPLLLMIFKMGFVPLSWVLLFAIGGILVFGMALIFSILE